MTRQKMFNFPFFTKKKRERKKRKKRKSHKNFPVLLYTPAVCRSFFIFLLFSLFLPFFLFGRAPREENTPLTVALN